MERSLIIMGITGHMGAAILRLAHARGLKVVAGIDRAEALAQAKNLDLPCKADAESVLSQNPGSVIIDFTAPAGTLGLLEAAVRHKNPMVIGTTGFTAEDKARVEDAAKNIPILLSPNMSLGVNALLEILPRLVRALGPGYDLEIVEMHHNRKKDAPSGTALRLGECLAEARNWKLEDVSACCREGLIGARPKEEIGIQTVRGGDVVGVHTVYLVGEGERIEVTHHAHSRDNFASGALNASQWLAGKKPGIIYSIQDMLREMA